jgi:biopolymer transport protein ExbD
MRKKKKKRRQEDVELNLAAMLDMAFQLLTFFILTFKPSPVEGQVLLRMPPPQPVTNIAGKAAGSDVNSKDVLKGLNTLMISAIANNNGAIRQLRVGETTMSNNLGALNTKLSQLLGDEGSGFEQVIIQVDSRLRYEALMQVIDVCTKQKLPDGSKLEKLSFVELPSGP